MRMLGGLGKDAGGDRGGCSGGTRGGCWREDGSRGAGAAAGKGPGEVSGPGAGRAGTKRGRGGTGSGGGDRRPGAGRERGRSGCGERRLRSLPGRWGSGWMDGVSVTPTYWPKKKVSFLNIFPILGGVEVSRVPFGAGLRGNEPGVGSGHRQPTAPRSAVLGDSHLGEVLCFCAPQHQQLPAPGPTGRLGWVFPAVVTRSRRLSRHCCPDTRRGNVGWWPASIRNHPPRLLGWTPTADSWETPQRPLRPPIGKVWLSRDHLFVYFFFFNVKKMSLLDA